MALFWRETDRFLKVWKQTIGAPLVSSLLYFVIFGGAIGSKIAAVGGISYLLFLVPGLAAMGIFQHAFQNTASSLIQRKMLGTMAADLIALPLTRFQIVAANVAAAMVRGILVGGVILIVARFFTNFDVAHPIFLFLSFFFLSGIFGILGFLAGAFLKTFDQISAIGNFLLTPLVYLGGVFFAPSMLPSAWQIAPLFNPIFYLVDLFRFSLLGVAEGNPHFALLAAVFLFAGFFWAAMASVKNLSENL